MNWEPLLLSDLPAVIKIAAEVHVSLSERPDVFEEKVRLYPQGCRKLVNRTQIVGYGISFAWTIGAIPPLDEFLGSLPVNPECIHIHDVVVLPAYRGKNAIGFYLDYVKRLALSIQLDRLALCSVYGTDVFWARFGFKEFTGDGLLEKLKSYGNSAKYMTCNL
jgi:GNAT superfamily N-acetyltransferase